MGKNGDSVYSQFYAPFLGDKQSDNPTNTRQALIERMYMREFTELCANRFKWVGLPDTIDQRFLELELFWRALCVFYYDNDFSRYFALRAAGSGALNMYDNPTSFTVIGSNMISKKLGPRECVPIWANYLRVPDLDVVSLYAQKLAEIDRTIEIQTKAMRYTTIVTGPESQRLSWQNIMRQKDEGVPVIFGTPEMEMSNVQAFNISPHPESLPNLLITKAKLWNECMTLLGINNANQDKKERLVSDEVDANNEQVEAARRVALNARQQAAAQINDMFDLSVSVDFAFNEPHMPNYATGPTDLGELEELPQPGIDEEVED